MSVSNRYLHTGYHTVKCETWWKLFLGRIWCMFVGHRLIVRFNVDDPELSKHRYCACCWKRLDDAEEV